MSTLTGRIPGRTGFFKLTYENGRITKLIPVREEKNADRNIWFSPGLFDIQVNGMLGYCFNSKQLSIENVGEIEAELEKHGITMWCPTVTTQHPVIVENNLIIIRKAIENKTAKNIHCIHLEGHYISEEDGYRGMHPLKYIRNPDPNEFDNWQKAAGGHIGYFSLAPDKKGAIDFIRKLVNDGVKVGLVHHNADYKTIARAFAAGASIATHLVNGCAKMIHRQHNVIWAQLSLDDMWASFIADGHHIPFYTLRAIIKSKGIERSILTSDLVGLSGKPEGDYILFGKKVVLEDGGIWVKDKSTGLLAGAVKTLEQQVEYLITQAGFSIKDALIMASLNPARYFGVENRFCLYPGRKDKIVIFSWDGKMFKVKKILKD